jgi:hypothetical protein
MMKNPTKPLGTAGKRKIQPVKATKQLDLKAMQANQLRNQLANFNSGKTRTSVQRPSGVSINPVRPGTYKPKKVTTKRKP